MKTERLGATLSLVMLGLLLSMFVPLPAREVRLVLLGSDLSLRFSGPISLALVLVALVCAGVDATISSYPQSGERPLGQHIPFWMLPATVVMLASVVLGSLWWGYQVALIVATTLMLAFIIPLQYHTVDVEDALYTQSRLVLNVITYIVALLLFLFLYGTRLRSLLSATGAALASGALALELFRQPNQRVGRIWLYAVVVAGVLGELTWALNYYTVDMRLGGAFLLLVFYALTGLVQQYLWGRLTRYVAVEYGLVCVAGLISLGLVGLL